ncbi:hypothetical protein D9M72_589770 [compost metagenome]
MDDALRRQRFEPVRFVACRRTMAKKERVAIDADGRQCRQPFDMPRLQLRVGGAIGQTHVGGIERQQISVVIA